MVLIRFRFIVPLGCCLLGSCKSIGPDYLRPDTRMPPEYRGESAGQTLSLPEGDWWLVFRDAALRDLLRQIESENFDLKAAMARIDRSAALVGITRADLFPLLGAGGSVENNRVSESAPFLAGESLEFYEGGLSLGWEIDVWGRIHRLVEAGRAKVEATAADRDGLLLSLKARAATAYFGSRSLDEELRVIRDAIDSRQKALDLQLGRQAAGDASQLEVARARSELASAEASAESVKRRRAVLEHGLAVLIGKAPSDFRLPVKKETAKPPSVDPGIPAALLLRRPDVFSAERRLAAANAGIGSAKAEFYPRFTLTGDGGLSSISAEDFLNWSSRTWRIGPGVDLPVFQGGKLKSNLKRAKAEYQEALADYQQQILVALEDVENALTGIHTLRTEAAAVEKAVEAASEVEKITRQTYDDGQMTYFEVVDAERVALDTKRVAAQLHGLRLIRTVELIQALGGGWQVQVPVDLENGGRD